MPRSALIVISLLSLLAGFAFYQYVPAFWKVEGTWRILSSQEITPKIVKEQHQKWYRQLLQSNNKKFIREKSCSQVLDIWKCRYHVSDRSHLGILKKAMDQGYQKTSGWAEPMVIKQLLQDLDDQITILNQDIAERTERQSQIENDLALIMPKIKALLQEQQLYQQDIDLRERQLQIYTELLPTMDENSKLYKVYQQKSAGSKRRIKELAIITTSFDRRIDRLAPKWRQLQTIKDDQTSANNKLAKATDRMDLLQQAQEKVRHDMVPHPDQHAFLSIKRSVKPALTYLHSLPAALVTFLLLTNIWLGLHRWRNKKNNPSLGCTIIDTDNTL